MKLFKPSSKFFTDRSKVVLLFVDPFLLFMSRVCHAVLYYLPNLTLPNLTFCSNLPYNIYLPIINLTSLYIN